MARTPSHGRRRMFIAGIIGITFGFGILLGASTMPLWMQQSEQQADQALLDQGQRIEEQFRFFLKQSEFALQANQNFDGLVYKGTINLNHGIPDQVESILSVAAQAETPDVFLQEKLTSVLKTNYRSTDVKLQGYFVTSFPVNEAKSKELLVLVKPTDVNKAVFGLIDVAKSMQHFQRFENLAALMNKKGQVLAHSSQTLIGIQLGLDKTLGKSIQELFETSKLFVQGQRKNLDQENLRFVLIKAGAGFGIMVEQKISPWTAIWRGPALSSTAGIILICLVGLCLIGLVAFRVFALTTETVYVQRPQKKQNETYEASKTSSVKTTPAPTIVPKVNPGFLGSVNVPTPSISEQLDRIVPVAQKNVQQAVAQITEIRKSTVIENESQTIAKSEVRMAANKRDSVIETQNALIRTKSEGEAEKTMAAIVSDLVDSPVLYFRYNSTTHQIQLAHTLGVESYSNNLQAPIFIRPDIEASVLGLANQGKAAALTNYGPIQTVMIQGVNTAHFEAWAVTTGPEMSPRGSSLMGVLVIQHSSFKSAEERPVLARILRLAANSIYGHRNKIRPRPAVSGTGANLS